MLNTIGDSLTNFASSNDEQEGKHKEDDEEDTELCKLSEDDEPGWVMGTLSQTVQQCMESLRQKPMRLGESTQLGWGELTAYFCEEDMKYWTAKLKIPGVVKPQTDKVAATPARRTFGELMPTVDVVPRQWQMQQGTSPAGSGHMMLGSEKPQSHKGIATPPPDTALNLSPIKKSKPVQPVSFYPFI